MPLTTPRRRPPIAPAKLTCPYCYSAFAPRDIRFRCSGRPAEGAACPVGPDPHLRSWFGDARALPPAFAADGRRAAAACPDCRGTTTQRICPDCHSRLPVHFGSVDSRLIAMIGARESGKTVFMTVLIHELMHRLGRVLDAAVVGSDDDTRRGFDRDYDRRLYQQHSLPAATTPAGLRSRRRPLVFRLTLQRRRFARVTERQTLLSFFDAAGEDLTTTESVERNAGYLAAADGIILLLDPLQLPAARVQARPDALLPAAVEGLTDHPFDVLTRVTDLLREAHGAPARPIRTPVAVVFTKLDALAHTLAPGSPLTRLPSPSGQFDEVDGSLVHDQVEALLEEWDGPRIDRLMRHHYAHFRYFGVSALGSPPRDPATVAEIRPHRVHDPFFWLLTRFGTIASVRG